MRFLVTLLIICMLVPSYSFAKEEESGYIFIGDSRFVGMNKACDIESLSDNYFVVAKVGMGYDWLIDTAMQQVDEIIDDNKDINNWCLVFGLGVNDIYNISKYCNFYEELSEDYNIVCLTVNPIEYNKYITNDDIEDFNKTLSLLSVSQVDTYSELVNDDFSTIDGLHYTDDTYRKIFSILEEEVLDKH